MPSPLYRFAVTVTFLDFPIEKIAKGEIEPPSIEYIQQQMKAIVDVADKLGIKSAVMQGEEGQGKAPDDYMENNAISDEDKAMMSEAKLRHIQMYMQRLKKARFGLLNKKVKELGLRQNWHIEQARGTSTQNIEYCTKGTGDWTYSSGVVKFSEQLTEPVWINKDKMVKSRGQRTDLKTIYEELKGGKTPQEIMHDYPSTYMRNMKAINNVYQQLIDEKNAQSRPENLECFLLYGKKGTGKTSDVLDKFAQEYGYERKDVFILSAGNYGNVWFNGYKGQKILLIDEYDPQSMPRHILLSIMNDNYRFKGEVKGQESITANWDLVFITSNYTPEEIFQKKVKVEVTDDNWNTRTITSWVTDEAGMSRVMPICYDNVEDKRKAAKKYPAKTDRENLNLPLPELLKQLREDVPSVSSLLPDTLEHGTSPMLNVTMQGCGDAIPTTSLLEHEEVI